MSAMGLRLRAVLVARSWPCPPLASAPERERERETHTHTERERERDTHRERERKRERERERCVYIYMYMYIYIYIYIVTKMALGDVVAWRWAMLLHGSLVHSIGWVEYFYNISTSWLCATLVGMSANCGILVAPV